AALSATRSGRVGVVGTVGTIASGAYQRLASSAGPCVEVHCAACPGFVEFVERGETETDQVHVLAERLLAPLREAEVDTLLLGCTHYPFLARTIGDVMGESVVLVSPAEETAFDVHGLISSGGLGRAGLAEPTERAGAPGISPAGRHEFYSSGDVDTFVVMGRRLLGPELDAALPVSFG
ncbi:MAG: glutamate racemase, partial [Acidimicrobiales bacterium]